MSASFKDFSKKKENALNELTPPPLPKYKATMLGVIFYMDQRPNFLVRLVHRLFLGIKWEVT